MSEIKSALEIALERTNNVQSDRTLLVKNGMIESGRRTAFEFLEQPEKNIKIIEEKIKNTPSEQKEWVKEGMLKVLLSYLKLPEDDSIPEILLKIRDGIAVASDRKKDVLDIFSQLDAFLKQYLQNKKAVIENLKAGYAKKLLEKEKALSRQLGSEVHLTPENDPEYLEHLHKTINQLDEQYQQIITQIKEEILKKN